MPAVGSNHYHEPDIVTNTAKRMRVKRGDEWLEKENVKTYTAECACGWTGPTRTAEHEADYDAMEHRTAENRE